MLISFVSSFNDADVSGNPWSAFCAGHPYEPERSIRNIPSETEIRLLFSASFASGCAGLQVKV